MMFRPACLGCGQPQPDAQFGQMREIRVGYFGTQNQPPASCQATCCSVSRSFKWACCGDGRISDTRRATKPVLSFFYLRLASRRTKAREAGHSLSLALTRVYVSLPLPTASLAGSCFAAPSAWSPLTASSHRFPLMLRFVNRCMPCALTFVSASSREEARRAAPGSPRTTAARLRLQPVGTRRTWRASPPSLRS
jgi:hypothetical protein